VAEFGGKIVLTPEPMLMTLPPQPEQFHGFFCGKQYAKHVEVELLVKQFLRNAIKRYEFVYPGVVHQDVHFPYAFFVSAKSRVMSACFETSPGRRSLSALAVIALTTRSAPSLLEA